MVSELISAALLIVTIVALVVHLRGRRNKQQLLIAQKRTEVLLRMFDIERELGPAIRNLQVFFAQVGATPPKLQSALDGMIEIEKKVQLRRRQLTDAISPHVSSQKVLLSLEPLLAELHQQVKKAHSLKTDVEALVAESRDQSEQAR